MTNQEQIEIDLYTYGVAYVMQLPDGTIERLDPRTLRVIRHNEKGTAKYITETGDTQEYNFKDSKW